MGKEDKSDKIGGAAMLLLTGLPFWIALLIVFQIIQSLNYIWYTTIIAQGIVGIITFAFVSLLVEYLRKVSPSYASMYSIFAGNTSLFKPGVTFDGAAKGTLGIFFMAAILGIIVVVVIPTTLGSLSKSFNTVGCNSQNQSVSCNAIRNAQAALDTFLPNQTYSTTPSNVNVSLQNITANKYVRIAESNCYFLSGCTTNYYTQSVLSFCYQTLSTQHAAVIAYNINDTLQQLTVKCESWGNGLENNYTINQNIVEQ